MAEETIPYKEHCPMCNNDFYFKEDVIKEIYKPITSKNKLKRLFGMNDGFSIHRYVQCPHCETIFKLRFTIDRGVINGNIKH